MRKTEGALGSTVKGLGFQLQFCDRINIGNFYRQMEKLNGAIFKYFGTENRIYTDVSENMIIGLVLCFKDQRKYMDTKLDAAGNFEVNKRELADGEYGNEAAVFCINPATSRGIFTTYFGGVGAGKMNYLFQEVHKELKKNATEAYIDLEDQKDDRTEGESEYRKEANAMFSGKFEMTIMASDDEFDEVIAAFAKVKAARFNVIPGLMDAPSLLPLNEHFSNSAIAYTFKKEHTGTAISKALKAVFKGPGAWQKYKGLKLMGQGLHGEELTYLVGKNKNRYLEMDYGKYVDALPDTTWNEFQDCQALDAVIQALRKYKAAFGGFPTSDGWLPPSLLAGMDLEYE